MGYALHMKKSISILALFLAISPIVASAEIAQNLKYGQSNPQVSELQEYLIDKNLLSSSATGFFGALTLKAVKAYQSSVGIPATGFVGPMTREKINADLASLTADANQAEIDETGTSTPVSYGPCSNGSVFNYLTGQRCDGVMTPPTANVGSPSAPLTPTPSQATVAPTMEYSIGEPASTCSGDKTKITFPITGSPFKVEVLSSSTNSKTGDVQINSTANGSFIKDQPVEFTFMNKTGDYSYTAKAYAKNGNVLAEKSGTYSVSICQ